MPTQIPFRPTGSRVVSRKGLERVADVDPRLTRSHYFDNRLLTAEDLNRDQIYLDERLREVGRVLGYGVVRGLDAQFDTDNGYISVQPGMAVSSAGRVLELNQSLTLDLNDRAKLSELNRGHHRRLNRALYALVIKYAEMGTDIAEVFPRDFSHHSDNTKTAQFDVMSEGVQLAMIRIGAPSVQQHPLQVRAHLMQQLYANSSASGSIPEDAVALGVLAIHNDRPQWFDSQLLRQPMRPSEQEGDQQADLYRRYQDLYNDVIDQRSSGSLSTDFAAADYFRWMPPVGSLPKASIDPVNGRQNFFPENYKVSIAPVRKSELDLLIKTW